MGNFVFGELGNFSIEFSGKLTRGFDGVAATRFAVKPFSVGQECPTTTVSATLHSMDYLWTPWRYAYITDAAKSDGKSGQCIFCELTKLPDDEAKIVYRGKHCFIILNSFPYTSGHVMVVPFAHLDELQKLAEAAATEMMALSQKMEAVLRKVYSPDGINLGMNIGRAAGAGVAGHVHMHVLPRWVGDTNFMTVTAESRVLPEALEESYKKITLAMAS
jgi:ATP adenylyltransferase